MRQQQPRKLVTELQIGAMDHISSSVRAREDGPVSGFQLQVSLILNVLRQTAKAARCLWPKV